MTEGTSQGLFVVVAIVIFGIFIGLTYTLFGSEGLSNDLENLFTQATETVVLNNGEKVNKNEVISFEDENLEKSIIEELKTRYNLDLATNKETGKEEVTAGNILAAESLDISSSNISDLSGIEYAVNLETLIASNNSISDIEPITKLSKLKTVDLSNNKIEYVNGIDNLTSLKELKIENNSLTEASVSHLKNLTNIDNLTLDEPYPEATDESLFTFSNGSIQKYTGTETDVVIPKEIDGIPVTSIADLAFYSSTAASANPIKVKLTSVVIPDTITNIGKSAFYANNLTEVIIPDSVKTIGDSAFSGNQLRKVDIGDSVTNISPYTFNNNKIVDVIIGNSVKEIGIYAFSNNQIAKISIPNSVTKINSFAFDTNRLNEVNFGNSLTTIGSSSFSDNQLMRVTIPNTVTTIGSQAFYSNNLTEVVVPDSVKTIGGRAFYDNQLLNVEINRATEYAWGTTASFDSKVKLSFR